ncbi:MAG: exodeoxyribonuclease V subunit alpha, partial [Desulfosudaceae bacterium]
MIDSLQFLRNSRLLDDIDIRFAELMNRLAGPAADPLLDLTVMLLNHIVNRQQHISLDLAAWGGRPLREFFSEDTKGLLSAAGDRLLPETEAWMDQLADSPVVGRPGQYRPLVLDATGRRLYLYRYWMYEQRLAAAIAGRIRAYRPVKDPARFQKEMARSFASGAGGKAPDWQKVAVFAALTRKFCVITGGPGTGKTYAVAGMLALLRQQHPEAAVALTAPTGKAAARLQASLAAAAVLSGDASSAVTIHRLLGAGAAGSSFRYHAGNRLPVDMVIVDEASMVSLPLMSRLLQALPDTAGVILLGDRNQLASVEAGAVLGDICRAASIDTFSAEFRCACAGATGVTIPDEGAPEGDAANPLHDCVVELKENHRFPAGSAIDRVSRAVQAGDAGSLREELIPDASNEITWRPLPPREELPAALEPFVQGYLSDIFSTAEPAQALSLLNRFRILCAHKHGPYGVDGINRAVAAMLTGSGKIETDNRFYHGRPVIVTRNDYRRQVYNGDGGMCWNVDG